MGRGPESFAVGGAEKCSLCLGAASWFFQRRHTDGQQTHEKILNITNHQENINQTHNEISPHSCQNDYYQNTTNIKCWWDCWKKGTLFHCWWECKLVQQLWKTVWRFLNKVKIKLPYGPAIPLLGIFLKKTKTLVQKDVCIPYVHCSIIYYSQDMEAT